MLELCLKSGSVLIETCFTSIRYSIIKTVIFYQNQLIRHLVSLDRYSIYCMLAVVSVMSDVISGQWSLLLRDLVSVLSSF